MVHYLDFTLKERISLYRKPLMGFAILWIFMLHSGKTGNLFWDAIRLYGWAGVDMFFFLSALGLCYSLKKNSDVLSFYKRRIIRVIPTWLVVLIMVHMLGLLCNYYLPALPFYVPNSIIKCITWYTGMGFFISDFVRGNGWFYEWYVPSLIVFYIVTPLFYKRKFGILVSVFTITFIIGFFLGHNSVLPNIHTFYHRIPIFLLGMLFYRLITKKEGKFFNVALLICLLLGVMIILYNIIFGYFFPKEYVALFLCPPFLVLLTYLFDNKYILRFLSFFGGISLELYLIHLYRRPHYLMSFVFDNKYVIIIISLIVCTFAAFMLQKIVNQLCKKVGLK